MYIILRDGLLKGLCTPECDHVLTDRSQCGPVHCAGGVTCLTRFHQVVFFTLLMQTLHTGIGTFFLWRHKASLRELGIKSCQEGCWVCFILVAMQRDLDNFQEM